MAEVELMGIKPHITSKIFTITNGDYELICFVLKVPNQLQTMHVPHIQKRKRKDINELNNGVLNLRV